MREKVEKLAAEIEFILGEGSRLYSPTMQSSISAETLANHLDLIGYKKYSEEIEKLKAENKVLETALETVIIKMFDYSDVLAEHWGKEIHSWDIPKHITRFKKEAAEKLAELEECR